MRFKEGDEVKVVRGSAGCGIDMQNLCVDCIHIGRGQKLVVLRYEEPSEQGRNVLVSNIGKNERCSVSEDDLDHYEFKGWQKRYKK